MTAPTPAFTLAFDHHRAGESPQAEAVCRQILERNPRDQHALHLLGVLAHQAGNYEAAIEKIRQAIAVDGQNPQFHYNLGVAFQMLGRLDEAAASYRETVLLHPGHPEAHNNLGHVLLAQSRLDEAVVTLREALRLAPEYPEALENLAKVLEGQGKLDEAAAHFRRALQSLPDNALLLNSLGNVLTKLGQPSEALATYEQALRIHPHEASFHSNLGNVLTLLGRPVEAEAHCCEALRLRPDFANAYHNLAIGLAMQGNIDQALRTNAEALRLEPDHAGAHNCQALWRMQCGNFEEGWPEYEWRWKLPQYPPRNFQEPLWDGSPLSGRTILIHAEQGLGDTLQFVRYVPLVKRCGGRVIVECQAALARLVSSCPGIDRLIPRDDLLPPFDVQAPLLSIPGILGTTLASVPAETPYLLADADLTERWRHELDDSGSFKIGIAWQGNPKFPGDCMRSIPLVQFAALARVEGARLFSLQKGAGCEQLATVANSFPLTDLGSRLDEVSGGFMDTAAVMCSLDLVITSDTAIAHLAGALGVPVWVALPIGADWRYLRDRSDSPWYPTMRLFRQRRLGDWKEVFGRIAAKLPPRIAAGWGACRQLASHWFVKAVEHHRADEREQAERLCRQILQEEPGHAEALNLLGVLAHQGGKHETAIGWLRQAIAADPTNAGYHYNLGVAQQVLGRLDDAMAGYRQTLRLQPAHAEAHNNLGYALAQQKQTDEAAAHYRQAVNLKPDYFEAYQNLGILSRQQGRLEEAVESFQFTVRLNPDHAAAHYDLGLALAGLGRREGALASFERALQLRPDYADAHFGRALSWLLKGEFERGWPEYEWRWRCGNSPPNPHRQPLWDGSPLDGRTILLHTEQGLGDTFQFIRYAPLVKRRGGKALLECPASLVSLLAQSPGIDAVIARGSAVPVVDVQAPLLSLPGIFGTTFASIPAETPYLFADPALVEHWRRQLVSIPAFKIGIAWQGDVNFLWDRQRSIPLNCFAALARVPGVQLLSLQKGAGREDLAFLPSDITVADLADRIDETCGAFMDTAAVMKNLDLVVTSDTSIAHLAGALGVQTWVGLACAADWRWLLRRDDSPWYPTMRLFRQAKPGDWDGVFARMAAELQKLTGRVELPGPIQVEIAPGELIDKITILEIKSEQIEDPGKLRNVRSELATLQVARDRRLPPSEKLTALTAELKTVNEALWTTEDQLRRCERDLHFGPRFVELARSVYVRNDRRAALKRSINGLLGSRLMEEKAYVDYQATAEPTPGPSPRTTICILTYGDHLPYFRRCLDSILETTPLEEIELRLGFNDAASSFAYALGRLVLAGSPIEEKLLPGGIQRESFIGRRNMRVRVWKSPLNLYKEPMARLMYHDRPLATEYVVWLDDDTFVETGWWRALCPLMDRRIDYIGQPWRVFYLPGQMEMIQAQPWYRRMPFELTDGRPSVNFMTGGFVAIRSERIRQANYPDTSFSWKGDTLRQYGGDTLLGEIAWQQGWTRAIFDKYVHINVDLEGTHPAPRRGGTGRQFGSNVDAVIG
jgi:tetratricopeptide (TPR) repeat protein